MQGTTALQLKEHDPLVNVKIDNKVKKAIIELSKKESWISFISFCYKQLKNLCKGHWIDADLFLKFTISSNNMFVLYKIA